MGKGICEICHSDTVAKCGEKIMWHWAHKSKQSCDPWWENETEWHRKWKAEFPEQYREVTFECADTGERHRADIVTDKGMVVEIQNSPISLEELRSREAFYENLVWVVNGEKFKSRFEISETLLPSPQAAEFDDVVFAGVGKVAGTLFWRRSENPDAALNPRSLVLIHSSRTIEQKIEEHYCGHHPFEWKNAHIAWLEASCPVLFDFGGEFLWRVEDYRDQFRCVRAISKRKFVHDVKTEVHATDIATKFYPINDDNKLQGAL